MARIRTASRSASSRRAAPPRPRRRAFTLVELSVSVGLLILAMVTVAGIFSISSDAAGRTASHAELLEASAALHQRLGDNLSRIVPGLLIIESPPPTQARAETTQGPRYFRLRHDRLVFVASYGGEGAFESVTDPTRGTPQLPLREPAAASDALVYFGPGIPVVGDGTPAGIRRDFADESIALTASEWVFLHRAILLLTSYNPADHPDWSPATSGPRHMGQVFTTGALPPFPGGMLGGGSLETNFPEYYEGRLDAVVSDPVAGGLDATGASLISFIEGHTVTDADFAQMFRENLGPARASALWEPSLAPITASFTDVNAADHFQRAAATFLPRLADFRIEWTDGGRIDPLGPDDLPNTGDEDFSTRWFGLGPSPIRVDGTNVPDITAPDDLRYQAKMRAIAGPQNPANPNDDTASPANPDNDALATAAFVNRIEWSPFGVSPNVDARYRAVWRGSDYDRYRPRALRFSYRLYDANGRIQKPAHLDLNDDGVADPEPGVTPFNVVRWGQEFSVVVALP
ncbi:MAG: hypothetical protein DCC65_04535 [Planctomycetota bacterium]|nr:MAG: hypothetical protein DCC65_04535 [Planctomycetota bacterium]